MATARRTATNENIQTYGDGTRDFTALATWESATDIDLVTATQSEVLECYDDFTSFDDNVNISGATTDASFFRIIRPAFGQGHDGTSNNGVYFNSTANLDVFFLGERHVQIQDLIITNTFNSGDTRHAIRNNSIGLIVKAIGNIIFDSVNSGAGTANGISASGFDFAIIDCLCENLEGDGFDGDSVLGVILYNCMAIDCVTGFDISHASTILKNCLGDGNLTADFDDTANVSNSTNASSDGTATGAGSRINQTFTFVNATGNDYHLAVSDTAAKNFGTDLSADATFAFDDDIDRQPFLVWDIGFDENDVFGNMLLTSRRKATSENIQTYGDATRDFTSLATWEAATDIDLVTATQSEVLECYDDAASFDDNVIISGATSDSSFFRIIRSASGQGHDGTSNNGVFFENTSSSRIIQLSENFSQAQDLILQQSINSASSFEAVLVTGDNTLCVGLIIFDNVNSGSGAARGFRILNGDGNGLIDCLVENGDNDGYLVADVGNFLYNCMAISNAVEGFNIDSSTTILKNCLSDSNTSSDFSGTVAAASTTNASSDGTATGSSPRISQTFTFVNAAGNDYHLATSDVGARNVGTDLAADTTFAFNDDIDFQLFKIWDIGFDESEPIDDGHLYTLMMLGVGF